MKKYRIRKNSIAYHAKKAGEGLLFGALMVGMFFIFGCEYDKAVAREQKVAAEVIEQVEITTDNYTYNVPLEPELQLYISNTCEDYGIDPALVIAMISVESSYIADTIGDGGDSIGLMQIQPKWHQERMARLGVTDLTNSYENVTVGIDYLAEKIRNYDTISEALTAYNAGDTGAYNLYFSKGIYANEYAKKVILEWVSLKEEECLSKSVKISEDLQL